MKRTTLALTALTIAISIVSCAHAGEGEPLNATEWKLSAASRIFALDNNLKGDIAVAEGEELEGHIGERFEVNFVKGEACKFTLRHRDGPIIQTIDFEKFTGEVSVKNLSGPYVAVTVPGLSGASCDIRNGVKTCKAGLSMTLFTRGSTPEPVLAMRALRYIAKTCPPTELP
jgi:hypothetical protein